MNKSFLIILITLYAACQNNKKTESSKVEKDINKYESVKTVTSFLKWYKDNYISVNRIILVNNVGGEYDSTKFYSVNFKGTEEYLNKLKSSGYISNRYVETWIDYFKKREANFQKNPANDGPPEGFDFDLVLWTQEVDETLDSIDKSKIIEVKESVDKSEVRIDIMMRLKFILSKNQDHWFIDNISNLGLE